MKRISLQALSLCMAAVLAACGGGQTEDTAKTTAASTELKATALSADGSGTGPVAVDARLRGASGKVDVWVALDQHSLARMRALLAESTGVSRVRALAAGGSSSAKRVEPAAVRSAMANQHAAIMAQQAAASVKLAALGATELGRVAVAYNAIAITIDASQLQQVAAMPGVLSVRPVKNYELHLSETVPYVGGSAVQGMGFDGTGVTVAVLDSGADYMHRNLGGPGTLADYTTCYAQNAVAPTGMCANYFGPGAPKVIGGFDFVGEAWPNGARTEDPNPIARTSTGGHGTHVADIIAGKSADGTHKGMAPGAKLLAVKVCSAVSTSCNGVALLKGVDFALDPNGDHDLSDAADVLNLSLGSDYGQIEDDLTQSLSNAVNLGVMVVASAGNGADRPYKVGSPSIAPGVLSVAQTSVPSAVAIPLLVNSPPAIAGTYGNTATLDWAPVGNSVTTGDVKTALQAGGANNLACAALPAGSLTGKIALIDRGTCAISVKVDNAANAGARGVLIALVAAGDAVSFSFGGGSNFVPSLVIQQSLGSAIKAQLNGGQTVNVSISPAAPISLVGSMAGTSSRGPSMSTQGIKPEIGAPGASVSAEVGTGSGETAFGGTSGAAPMVAGAAALMVQAHPARSALQIKAMLMNAANTAVYTNQAIYPGQLAPISRIGAGELRVNRSVLLGAAAWDKTAKSAALAFGAIEADQQLTVTRTLTVENYSASAKTFSITPSFRNADDQASDAVRITSDATVSVPANGSTNVTVTMLINPTKLPSWTLNGGSLGGNGQLLNGPEYDGYLTLVSGGETLSVPWHVLPRKAASTTALPYSPGRSGSNLTLRNVGAETGDYSLFSLTGSSPQLPANVQPNPGDNFAILDLKSVGVRAVGTVLQFAISTYGRRASPLYPGGFEVDIDTNGDGVADWYVFQQELGGFGATGQSAVYVQKAGASTSTAYYFNGADFNSGNLVFTLPMSAIGVSAGSTIGFDVIAYDNYFSGLVSDTLNGMKYTVGGARFEAGAGASPDGTVARATSLRVPFNSAVVPDSKSSEKGVLLMFGRNAAAESQEVLLPIPTAP